MSRLRRSAVVAVALSAGSPGATLGAQPPAGADAPRLVRGRVLDAESGAPVADARILARGASAALTGTSGLFALRLAGGATLVAARLGYAPETLLVARADTTAAFRLRRVPLTIDPVVVAAERASTAASSATIRTLDVALRPRASSQELLRLAPGLVIAQHAGGGKAEQIFLRGFDADHGTDVALSVDGVPVNMVTHAHGQGYADLHFLMPEVVEGADVRKGPYDVRDGDFATAGAVAFRTRDRVGAARLEGRVGSFSTRHAVGLLPLGGDATRAGGYVAASAHRTEGPFEAPQGYRRVNGFAKWTAPVGAAAELVATASAFDARWDASGQLPARAVRAGLVSRFGALDPTEGGATSRYDATLGARNRVAGPSRWEARAFVTRYRFDLFSNFTFFLADSVHGDGIEQADDRTVLGASGSYGRAGTHGGRPAGWSVGAGARLDAGDVALYRQRERARLGTPADVRSRQAHLYDWVRYETQLTARLRADVGVRGDLFRFSIADRLAGRPSPDVPRGSGTRWLGVVSPKANLALDLTRRTTLFANAGSGFHSNDGRDAVLARRGERVLPRAVGGEVGARHTWAGGTVALALWGLDLQSELVYVGDEGVTEPSGRTWRVGADAEGRVRLARWVWADADVNVARGRFRDAPAGADRIPLAPALTGTAGLTVRDPGRRAASGPEGGVRVRHVGSRPATEDAAVRASGSTLWELFGGYSVGRVRLTLAVDNLLGARWNEAQFATTSRLRGEAAPVTELHVTPGAPRALTVGAAWAF